MALGQRRWAQLLEQLVAPNPPTHQKGHRDHAELEAKDSNDRFAAYAVLQHLLQILLPADSRRYLGHGHRYHHRELPEGLRRSGNLSDRRETWDVSRIRFRTYSYGLRVRSVSPG
jgi:hypothetical protein